MLVMDNATIHHIPEILELADRFSEFADLSYIVIQQNGQSVLQLTHRERRGTWPCDSSRYYCIWMAHLQGRGRNKWMGMR